FGDHANGVRAVLVRPLEGRVRPVLRVGGRVDLDSVGPVLRAEVSTLLGLRAGRIRVDGLRDDDLEPPASIESETSPQLVRGEATELLLELHPAYLCDRPEPRAGVGPAEGRLAHPSPADRRLRPVG